MCDIAPQSAGSLPGSRTVLRCPPATFVFIHRRQAAEFAGDGNHAAVIDRNTVLTNAEVISVIDRVRVIEVPSVVGRITLKPAGYARELQALVAVSSLPVTLST
jgi:hypothetical protein